MKKKAPPAGSVSAELERYEIFFGEKEKAEMRGLSTGFEQLDARIGGMAGIWVLGSPPSHGKTTLVTTVATHVVSELAVPTLCLSLEMSGDAFRARLVAHILRRPQRYVESKVSDPEEKRRFTEWAKSEGERLGVYSRAECPSASDLADWTGWPEPSKDSRVPRGLVVVDSLQKLARLWHPRAKNETEALDATLDDLLGLVDGNGLTFLCISRLPKGTPAGDFVFRGSGSQEYDCDVVLTLRAEGKRRAPRTGKACAEPKSSGVPVELSVRKNRAGETGFSVKLIRLDGESRMVEAP